MNGNKTYVEIWVPLAVYGSYTYEVPENLIEKIQVGKRVLVSFGKQKYIVGVIVNIKNSPGIEKTKLIIDVLDDIPTFPETSLKLYKWIARYYLCTEGEVLKAALPEGLEINIHSNYMLSPIWTELVDDKLYEKIHILINHFLQNNAELPEDKVLNLLPKKNRKALLKKLIKDKILIKLDIPEEKFKPKKITVIDIPEDVLQNLNETINSLTRAPKQQEAFLRIFSLKQKKQLLTAEELRKEFNISYNTITALTKKKLLEKKQITQERYISFNFYRKAKQITLTSKQQETVKKILSLFEQDLKPVLLHGITGSGKTYIYIELIKKFLQKEDAQILYLLPEIALTKQIIDKLYSVFGSQVGIYHSKLNIYERVEIWRKVYSGEYKIVIGARSALLLPFRFLKLIIIDEEHDTSFKQHEPPPRYNARDSAIYYANMLKINVILGSATPAIESYYNATSGKYHLVKLKELPVPPGEKPRELPETQIVDMRPQVAEKISYGTISYTLIEEIKKRLQRKEQIVLFRNRRGYAPYVSCKTCGYVFYCKNCDITLTYHKNSEKLSCHYCGYSIITPSVCPKCNSSELEFTGIGTERIEEHLRELFPEAKIQRMDLDTTRGKHAYEEIIANFEDGKIDILLGTQMITKGLDVENVTLSAILDADKLLYYPDFRAEEHAYQLMIQFRGRSARSNKKSLFIIQTFHPENPFFGFLFKDYEDFYEYTVRQRENAEYPPFTRLILIETRYKDLDKLSQVSSLFIERLKKHYGKYILGPVQPNVVKVRNYYRLHSLLKILPHWKPSEVKSVLLKEIREVKKDRRIPNIQIIVNVDPLMF